MVRGLSKFWIACLVAGSILAAGEMSISIADAGPAPAASPPQELLEDGIDAVGDNRPDLAVKIFETLLAAYPQSAEARKAAAELAKLNSHAMPADDSGDTNDVIDADGGAKTADEPEPSVRVGVREAADDGATAALSSERLRKLRFRFLAEVGDRVFFAENSATIGGRARAILEAQGRWLKAAKGLDVTIIGRSADGLDKDASAALSMARAKAVEAKLIEAGVPPERIKIEARGSADPVATCDSAMCRAQNRHAESLLGMPGMGGHAGRPQVLGGAGDTTGRTPPRTASTRTLAR